MGNYTSDLVWGTRHIMATQGGSHSEEKVLITSNYPGMPAG